MENEVVKIEEKDIDLDALLGSSIENVITPGTEEQKPNMFARDITGDDILNAAIKDADVIEGEKILADILDAAKEIEEVEEVETDKKKSTGRPKVDKEALYEFTKKLIDKGNLIPFDDEKPLEEYTLSDYEELYEANEKEKQRKLEEEIPLKFYDALPEEMQYAAKYVADGGKDLKGLFRMLAQVEEVKDLNPANDNDAELIVRNYLQATKFGDANDIQEEIDAWKDRGDLEAKANKFKPKLDAMQEQLLQYKIKENEDRKKAYQEQYNNYVNNVYDTLKTGVINGIKLENKTRDYIYDGLINSKHTTRDGKPTNILGHLIETHQSIKPNHALIAEAVWLLSDPEAYRAKLRAAGSNEQAEKTARLLKTEESKKTSSTNTDTDEDNKKIQNKLNRPAKGFLTR